MKMIQTVLGWIEREAVSAVLPHEHILSDLRPLVEPVDNGVFYEKVALHNYGELSRNPYAVLDNAVLDDREAAIDEFIRLNKTGFNLVADVTTADFGRDVRFLRELSQKTGVHIVAGCGCYVDGSVREEWKQKSVTELREMIFTELTEGIDGTDIKAGVIGEIGSGEKISEYEYKFLKAAAEAQRETGFGMHIHACLWNREGLNALDYAVNCGADACKVCVDHADVLLDRDYILGILDRGAYVEFDDFGKEYYVDRENRNLLKNSFAHDVQRVERIKELIERGYVSQILITNDICLKSMLHAYGGWGYDHIPRHILPMMEDYSISKQDIDTIIRENPLRFLEKENHL